MDEKILSAIHENLQRVGAVSPYKDDVLTEAAENLGYSGIQAVRSLGNSFKKWGFGGELEQWGNEQAQAHRNWGPYPGYKAWSLDPTDIARTIGGVLPSVAAPVVGGMIGTLASGGNPLGGVAGSTMTTYAMLYGDTVDEYRKAMPNLSDTSVEALAMFSAFGQSVLESFLGGDARLLKGMGREIAEEALKKTTRSLAARYGREIAIGAVQEGSEEVLQLFLDNLVKSAGARELILPSVDEIKENFASGAFPGAIFGGVNGVLQKPDNNMPVQGAQVQGTPMQENQVLENQVEPEATAQVPAQVQAAPDTQTPVDTQAVPQGAQVPSDVAPEVSAPPAREFDEHNLPVTGTPENQQAITELVTGVGDYLGIKVDFMDNLPDSAELQATSNGMFDPATQTIYLNRNTFSLNPAETLGHELKEYLDINMPEVMQGFDEIVNEDLTELGIEVAQEVRGDNRAEFIRDIFGKIAARPDTWQKVAIKLEEKQSGIGVKFLNALKDLYGYVKKILGKIYDQTPELEALIKNVDRAQTEVVNTIAHLRQMKMAEENITEYRSRFGNIINTDNAKLLFEKDGYNPHDEKSVRDFHSKTSSLIPGLFKTLLAERKNQGNGYVVFTGGGNGSGKSSALANNQVKKADFVFDSAMVNYTAAVNSIQKVIDNGQKPLLFFVYRNPADAWFNGVMKRNQEKQGHIVPESVFVNTHVKARETFLHLVEDFGSEVRYIIREVSSGKENKEISLDELKSKPTYTKELIQEAIHAKNYEDAKAILVGRKKDSAPFRDMGVDSERRSSHGRGAGRGNRGIPEASEKLNKSLKTDEFYNPAVGESFDDFYERFKPQRDAIITLEHEKGFGNKKLDDLRSAADVAIWNAYQNFTSDKGAKIDTYASTAVRNAIRDKFRAEYRQTMPEGKTAVALDQKLESGDTVGDTIGIEDKDLYFDEVSISEMPIQSKKRIVKWVKENGTRRQKLLVKAVFIDKTNLSDAARADGVGLKTAANASKVLGQIADKAGVRYSKKYLHHQINPIVRDGVVRKEWEFLLARNGYTPKTIKQWDTEAFNWIIDQGGILPAMEKILKNQQPGDRAVAEFVRLHIANSDVYANHTTYETRVKFQKIEQDTRSSWGEEGRAMQLASYRMDSLEAVQAFFNRMQENMPDEAWRKMRKIILKRTGIDILKLDQKVVDDRKQLDAILREAQAHSASFLDKVNEVWLSFILSGPNTQGRNILGNTANASYEMVIKRFVEATINTALRRKDGISFGEFKAMWSSINWEDVRQRAADAWNLEVIGDEHGKFTLRKVAIGGWIGRTVRTSFRLLSVGDAIAKGIIEPMETAAKAYSLARAKGLKGQAMKSYMEEQISNENSASNAYARERALEMTFQENPGSWINKLISLREDPSWKGALTRFFLPFIKGPANIFRQGVRKSPIGVLNPVMWKSIRKGIKGDAKAKDMAVARVAEQLIAWGTVMMIASLSDGDDEGLPWITGSPASYGSNKANFMRDKIPPYSIRIGNTYYSYQGFEPLSNSLAVIVDGVQAFRDARNGKDGTAICKRLLSQTGELIASKSFMGSVSQIIKLINTPDSSAAQWGTTFLASWVPNVVRQTIGARHDYLSDTKSRSYGSDWWKDQIDVIVDKTGIIKMYPKIDYFGRPVKKDAYSDEAGLWFLMRLTPVDTQDAGEMDDVEKLIWTFNQRNINNQYFPGLPSATFDHDKKKCYFDNEQYHDFAVEAGQLAHQRLSHAVRQGRLNVSNPTQRDIDYIKKIFSAAREEVQDRFIKQNRYHVR